jgi:hypothetical protein
VEKTNTEFEKVLTSIINKMYLFYFCGYLGVVCHRRAKNGSRKI